MTMMTITITLMIISHKMSTITILLLSFWHNMTDKPVIAGCTKWFTSCTSHRITNRKRRQQVTKNQTILRNSTWCFVAAKTTICSDDLTTFSSRWSKMADLSSERHWRNAICTSAIFINIHLTFQHNNTSSYNLIQCLWCSFDFLNREVFYTRK